MGTWIEINVVLFYRPVASVVPSWARGLKFKLCTRVAYNRRRALMGTWIEIPISPIVGAVTMRRALMGTWIEIIQ